MCYVYMYLETLHLHVCVTELTHQTELFLTMESILHFAKTVFVAVSQSRPSLSCTAKLQCCCPCLTPIKPYQTIFEIDTVHLADNPMI